MSTESREGPTEGSAGASPAAPSGPAPAAPSSPAPWYRRWLPELLVLLVVALALVEVRYDVAGRVLGIGGDVEDDPAAVGAPAGIHLPPEQDAPPVARPVPPASVDARAVGAAIRTFANDPDLGPHREIHVLDLRSGKAVFDRGRGSTTPASTLKLLTSAAALHVLGPGHRFTTKTVLDGTHLFLVGGGDPYLASGKSRGYPKRTSLDELAARTATALQAQGLTRVGLRWDDSLFTGPSVNPAWPASYLPENVVPPITALWEDQGHKDGRYSGFVDDPARDAAEDFRRELKERGITVVGFAAATAPSTATTLAAVRSATLAQIVEETLAISDNQAAELLGRHVGLAVLEDGSFEGGARAVRQTLTQMGVPMDGARLYDGSGLSRQDRISPAALLQVLRLATLPENPELRPVVTGLPVAGYTGSLAWRFDDAPLQAHGMVRAKTGTLTGVHGLAGIVTDRSGALMAFVAIADQAPLDRQWLARKAIDDLAAALGACACGT